MTPTIYSCLPHSIERSIISLANVDLCASLASLERTIAVANDYEESIQNFMCIRASQIILVGNESDNIEMINKRVSLEILHAMLEHKPVVLFSSPTFTNDIDTFTKNIILKRINKLIICNIQILDKPDLERLLSTVAENPINYVLTNHEEILIKSKIRSYLRDLLDLLK